jgi:hypothetical protein
VRLGHRKNLRAIGRHEVPALIADVKSFGTHGSLLVSGGIARDAEAARGSAAVKARRSRLAEHGAQRRAHGLDGETRAAKSKTPGNPNLSSEDLESADLSRVLRGAAEKRPH